MAKRFGRNQRRHMREEIARLDRAHRYAVDRYEQAERDAGVLRSRLERWATDIRHLLGDESAFNETVRRIEVDNVRDYGGGLRLAPQSPTVAPVRTRGEMPFYGSVSTVIEAALYVANVSVDIRERMSQQVRIRLTGRNGDVAYAMNSERHHAWSPRDVDEIGRMIAHEMAKFLDNEGALDKRSRLA